MTAPCPVVKPSTAGVCDRRRFVRGTNGNNKYGNNILGSGSPKVPRLFVNKNFGRRSVNEEFVVWENRT